jgi:hypothetical protein
MQEVRDDGLISTDQQASWEWAKLLRKLRWIGMDEEARCLEQALRAMPAEERGVSPELLGTD